ncbi:sigma-54-dependent Fis family transcriptional regulator [Lignipirellula cremea]|uniref:Nitrogen fixation protein VnfA n=1 Tax=Lignipirellula cremea TaxID=2528010 RepID=A0A518DNN5_9BACT|nr:sigma-54-dependent Fis family transcriptional regulator [Lignipirellula cremea]QDU93445.1 Nitrogen fixation protein VnfA [Lignipirellula cremea]
MTTTKEYARFAAHPDAMELSTRAIYLATLADTEEDYLRQALPLLLASLDCRYLALSQGRRGKWRVLAEAGPQQPLPFDLLSDALDRDQAVTAGDWLAAPLEQRSTRGQILTAYQVQARAPREAIDSHAALLNAALSDVRERTAGRRRIRRLEAILEIAGQWRQTLEMGDLLKQMAETSTRLLEAERASIFLWDQPNRTLVARPALGVDSEELRIPDDSGIVGQVIQSGESRRVDADRDDEQREIDRSVDQKHNFQTRSLLCIPLRNSDGHMLGAFEMINKIEGSFSDEDEAALVELASHAAIALENSQQYEQLLNSRNQMAEQAAKSVKMIGDCAAVNALRSTVRRVADTELAVLILGENGTGKEVISQQVHYLSRRRNEPFIAVNCAALPDTLLESELFGHEKGAFTDAHERRSGKFELASGGTLFLDEIGDMSLSGQAKLLRVLEEKVVVRVGGSQPIHTDARVIAATNQNLATMVREKRFREDLYFRLCVVTIELPALRDRGDDVILLAEHFLRDFCAKARRKMPRFTAAARKRMLGHGWPGNVRELRNLMERLAYLTQDDKIDADDLNFILSPGKQEPSLLSLDTELNEATRQFQIEYIKRHIERARSNMTEAARRLGLHRSNLYRKMKQLGMDAKEDDDED